MCVSKENLVEGYLSETGSGGLNKKKSRGGGGSYRMGGKKLDAN